MTHHILTPADLTVACVSALEQEAALAGDYATVRDCRRTAEWLSSGAAWRGKRCIAAKRVCRILNKGNV